MNRSGALKITALFVVVVLCLSTVGFGLLLASDNTSSAVAGGEQPTTGKNTNNTNPTNLSDKNAEGFWENSVIENGDLQLLPLA